MNTKRPLLILSVCMVAFATAWGVITITCKTFPYDLLIAVKHQIQPRENSGHMPSCEMPHWKMEVSQFERLQSQPDIVMFGDSITATGEWQELFPGVSIVNRGIAKDTTDGLLKRASEVAERNPRAVFIMIGINDVGTGVNIETIQSNYMRLIEYFTAKGIRTVVQSTILPGKNINKSQHKKVAALNEMLASVPKTNAMSSFIDLNNSLAPEGFLKEDYSLDGIHLNGLAYELWSEQIQNQVREISETRN